MAYGEVPETVPRVVLVRTDHITGEHFQRKHPASIVTIPDHHPQVNRVYLAAFPVQLGDLIRRNIHIIKTPSVPVGFKSSPTHFAPANNIISRIPRHLIRNQLVTAGEDFRSFRPASVIGLNPESELGSDFLASHSHRLHLYRRVRVREFLFRFRVRGSHVVSLR